MKYKVRVRHVEATTLEMIAVSTKEVEDKCIEKYGKDKIIDIEWEGAANDDGAPVTPKKAR